MRAIMSERGRAPGIDMRTAAVNENCKIRSGTSLIHPVILFRGWNAIYYFKSGMFYII